MKTFHHTLLAGMLIGMGGYGFLGVRSREIGALLFCVGLYGVLVLGVPLYTGRCGYAFQKGSPSIGGYTLMLLGNLAGAALVGLAFGPMGAGAKDAAAMALSKLSQPFLETLLRGIGCGMMMFIAVDSWKRLAGAERALGVLLAVPVFILAGFEHCIADAFYFAAAFSKGAMLDARLVPFMISAIIGNTLGALAVYFLSPRKE